MAWKRDEANLGISGATAYSYTEVDWSVNATHAVYRHIGGVTSPYNFGATATSTLQWWESGTWHDYAGPASHYFSGYGDQPILDVEDSFVRQAADRTVSLGCYTTMMGGGARAWIDYTVPHLAPSVTWASSNPVVRNSDNSITLTWNAPSLEYSAMCIEVQTDNSGTWSQEIVLWNTATSTTWTGCSAGHSYQFRIRTNYLASYSAYDTCATIIYNTPLPPEGIATKATSGTNVTVTLNNPSPVATSCDYRLGDGTNWGTVVTGQSTSSFTVDMGAYHYIQVRNTNATGSSAWLTSEYVNTVTKPNTPNITSPVAGYVDMAAGTIRWEWTYSSPDNSEQTQFTFMWWKNSTLQTPVVQSTANHYYVQDISALSAGDEIVARITVKGASSTASTASAAKTVMLYTKPTVTISSPSASVTSMPLSIAATYSDMAGYTCQAATVTLKQGDRTILTKPATVNGTAITASIGIDEALLDNGASYTVVITARSSSGLQASANATFTTAFVPPKAGDLQISNDADTGYVSLLAQVADDEQAQGESVRFKWNQLAPTSASYDTQSTKALTSGATFTASHKLYFAAKFVMAATGSGYPSLYLYTHNGSSSVSNGYVNLPNGSGAGTYDKEKIITISESGVSNGTTATVAGNAWLYYTLGGTTTTISNISLIDLTEIYGAGNEPSTVEAFKATQEYQAMQAQGKLYAYDGGSMQSNPLPLDTSEGDYLHAVEIQGAAQRFAPTFTDYAGNTNTQYDSTAGSVGRLTVEGKSAKWNQVATSPSITSGSTGGIAKADGVLAQNTVVAGHKYCLTLNVVNATVAHVSLYDDSGRLSWVESLTTGELGIITTVASGDDLWIYSTGSSTGYTGATLFADHIMLVDLTAIFGAGNEPATVDAFKATDVYKAKLAVGELYAYDAGSLVSIGETGGSGNNWNQYADAGLTHATRISRMTAEASGSDTVCTVSVTSSQQKFVEYDFPADHKIFLSGRYVAPTYGCSVGVYAPAGANYSVRDNITGPADTMYERIFTTDSTYYAIRVCGFATTIAIDTSLTIKNLVLVDLTAIYGAGNEPKLGDPRIAWIKAYAKLHPAYDAGSNVPCEGVWVVGRNLFDAASSLVISYNTGAKIVAEDGTITAMNTTSDGRSSNYASCDFKFRLPAGSYRLTLFTTVRVSNSNRVFTLFNSSGSIVLSATADLNAEGTYQHTFTLAADTDLGIFSKLYAGAIKVMIYKGDALTEYVPYSQTLIPARIRSAGSVHDVLMADEDSWTVRRKIGVYTFTGTEEPSLNNWRPADGFFAVGFPLSLIPDRAGHATQTPANIMMAEIGTISYDAAYGSGGVYVAGIAMSVGVTDNTYSLFIRLPSLVANSKADVQAWLSGKTLFYELATPTQDADTSMSTLTIGSAFTVLTDLDSTFSMKATADLFDPYVLTTTGTGTVSGGTITHQAISLTTSGETYADVLHGEWLAGIGDIKDTASIGATTTIERRVGCVDLGSLTWGITATDTTNVYRMYADLPTAAYAASNSQPANLICSAYDTISADRAYLKYTGVAGASTMGRVFVYDPYYNTSSSAAAFKTAMSGVLLYYELETPTTESVTGTDYGELEVPDWLTLNAYQDSPITALYGNGIEDVDSISVARVNADGSITPLLEDGQAGAGIVDKYAPLNTPYQYAVTTMSAAHAVNTVYIDNEIITDLWFAYWTHKDGDTVTEVIASAKWNPDNGGLQVTRPQKTRVYYAGRKDPVSYDGSAVALSETPSWMLVDRSEVQPFVQLIEDGGRGVYKSCDGWVYHADFDMTLTPKYTAIGYYGGIMLSVTRIAGEQL